jgi:hypothetical protein
MAVVPESHLPRDPRLPLVVLGAVLISVVFGLVAGQAVVGGKPTNLMLLVVVAFVPVIVIWAPRIAVVGLLAGALLIEQTPVVGVNGLVTDHIPLFSGVSQSAHGNAVDILIVMLLVVLMIRGADGTTRLPRTTLGRTIAWLCAAVVFGLLVGMLHHGNTRVALMEIRPFLYLASAYVLTHAFLGKRSLLNAALWVIVLASAVKGVQAILAFMSVRSENPRPESILGHEEALLFGVFVMLTASLWLLERPGALRTAATWLLPIVLVGDMVNSRRTAWLILAGGLIIVGIVGAVTLPGRRRFLVRTGVWLAAVLCVYLPVYWNQTGTLGQPARAVHSFISPNPRDASSDLYRAQENANLTLNIHQGGLVGKGFGVPIDYALPIANISKVDPEIAYVPHNGVLYIVMRMGLFGAIAFWCVIGVGLITACRLAGRADRDAALIGFVTAASIVGYTLQGYNDQGFFFYRIAICMGVLLGLTEVATRLADATDKTSGAA